MILPPTALRFAQGRQAGIVVLGVAKKLIDMEKNIQSSKVY